MHPINQVFYYFGFLLTRVRDKGLIPGKFVFDYYRNLRRLKKHKGRMRIYCELRYEPGSHPECYRDYECYFAANHLKRLKPQKILDIGSSRLFITGLLSHFHVTTIDVRSRPPISSNESIITCDAKKLELPDGEFDVVLSMCALEHFGLGRYGDEFDLAADKKAFQEMQRVLKNGGSLIFTTHITRAEPHMLFNAHKTYSLEMIREFCEDLTCEDEKFYSRKTKSFCTYDDITTNPIEWDMYCGCWKKITA